MKRRLLLLVMAVLLASLSACSSGTTPAPATVAPMAAAAPTATTTAPSGSGGEPFPAEEPVDLVVMAASGGAGIAERYGPFLEEALGRKVRAHSKIGSLPTEILSGTEGREVAELVAGAKVIVFNFPRAGASRRANWPAWRPSTPPTRTTRVRSGVRGRRGRRRR